MDVFNAGLVRLSCLQAGEAVLEQKTQMITKTRQTSCEYESGTSEWEEDPCCNDRLEVWAVFPFPEDTASLDLLLLFRLLLVAFLSICR